MRNLFPELRILDVAYNALTETLRTSLFQHLKAIRGQLIEQGITLETSTTKIL